LTSILLIAIIFVWLSPSKAQSNETAQLEIDIARTLPFAIDDNEIDFPASKYDSVLNIIRIADQQAMRCEMYVDSSVRLPIGRIDRYKFDYLFIQSTKTHFIVIRDTIENDSVYFNKYTTFEDNLNNN